MYLLMQLTQIKHNSNNDDAIKQNIHSQVLQNVILGLERAFQKYHRDRKGGQPRFKRHGRYNSITYPQYGSFSIRENRLKLSFVNGLIKIKMHNTCWDLKSYLHYHKGIERWFVCLHNNDYYY